MSATMKVRRKTVNIEVDVSDTVYVDIEPEDYPELVEWAESRAITCSPSLALDTIQGACERLRLIVQCPASDSLDRGEIDVIADELRDVWLRVTRESSDR